ncbi:MAG: DUF4136 domain-containing protein [Planctomycetes bacterium]|nr:DUF4136 domain-containing protein [Planctomycetota bacterium]
MRSTLALVSVLFVVGCAAPRIEQDCTQFGAVEAPAKYTWLSAAPSHADTLAPAPGQMQIDDPGLLEEVRLLADEQFTARDFTLAVPIQEARYIAVPRVWVEVHEEWHDPLFSASNVARFERGGVGIDLYDAKSGQRVWCGGASTRLRDVALGYGVKLRRYALTGEERAWQIPAKVDALFKRFPIERP